MPQIIGLLLAGGRGRRFDPSGQHNKLLACLPDGQTVLHASCRNMLAWVDRLVVVTGSQITVLRQALQDLDVDWIECASVDQGIGATLKAGVSQTAPGLGWLVGLADMPFVAPQTYRVMVETLRGGARLARPVLASQPGHPVACAAGLRPELSRLSANAGLSTLAHLDPDAMQAVNVDDGGCVRDIDLPGDLPGALTLFPSAGPG